jgi:hypothetical protein
MEPKRIINLISLAYDQTVAAINYNVSVGITVSTVAKKQCLQIIITSISIIMSRDSSLGIETGWMAGVRFPRG